MKIIDHLSVTELNVQTNNIIDQLSILHTEKCTVAYKNSVFIPNH